MRTRSVKRVVCVGVAAVLLSGSAAIGAGGSPAGASVMRTRVLAGSTARSVRTDRQVGSVAESRKQTVQLWLRGDSAGAEKYALAVSDPGSSSYHHYLSPASYTRRFAVTTGREKAVASWLVGHGFTDVQADAQRNYVRATATTGIVESTFHVALKTYRRTTVAGTAVTYQSNDRDLTLPATVAADVLSVTGLNTTQPTTQLATNFARSGASHAATAAKVAACSAYYGQHTQTHLPRIFGTTSLPTHICGYNGTQLRAAYGMNSANTGRGVTVAYVEVGVPYRMFDTLTRWAKDNRLPAPASGRYQQLTIGRGSQCGNPFNIEEQLDIEAGYAMAPAQHQLLIGGDSCDQRLTGVQALFDADLAVLNGDGYHPLATIASNSWGYGGEYAPGMFINAQHAIMLRAVAEGVGMYFASGDGPGVALPAADPDAIAVGGTSLGIDRANKRLFETGWSNDVLPVNGSHYDNYGINAAAGGGTSMLWSQPTYQAGVVPTAMATPPGNRSGLARVVPDISALADLTTGIREGLTKKVNGKIVYSTFAEGGTSLAAPLVAGIVAAAQQGQPVDFGFTNPALYRLSGTAAIRDTHPVTNKTPTRYRAVFCPNNVCIDTPAAVWTFDSQDRPLETQQVTATGYDTMTGIGTPNGQNFINALRAQYQT